MVRAGVGCDARVGRRTDHFSKNYGGQVVALGTFARDSASVSSGYLGPSRVRQDDDDFRVGRLGKARRRPLFLWRQGRHPCPPPRRNVPCFSSVRHLMGPRTSPSRNLRFGLELGRAEEGGPPDGKQCQAFRGRGTFGRNSFTLTPFSSDGHVNCPVGSSGGVARWGRSRAGGRFGWLSRTNAFNSLDVLFRGKLNVGSCLAPCRRFRPQ